MTGQHGRTAHDEAWEEGFRSGVFAGRILALSDSEIDDTFLLDLIRFVHPDRNPDRQTEATRLTAALNRIRESKR